MLDRRLIREQPERVRRSLARRLLPTEVVDDLLALDTDWRTAVTAVDAAKAERNAISAQFAKAKGQNPSVLAKLREHSSALGERIASQEQAAASLETRIDALLADVPNILADDVPDGADTSANVVVRSSVEPPKFAFEPKPHWEIGEHLRILDFERGVRLARSRFTVIAGAGARLNRALIDFFLERNIAAGFSEINAPLLVNRESVEATGHLSKFSDAMFAVDDGTLFLSPTSEVQLVNLHRGEILEAEELPK